MYELENNDWSQGRRGSTGTDESQIRNLEAIPIVDSEDLASISEAWARANGEGKWDEPSSIS